MAVHPAVIYNLIYKKNSFVLYHFVHKSPVIVFSPWAKWPKWLCMTPKASPRVDSTTAEERLLIMVESHLLEQILIIRITCHRRRTADGSAGSPRHSTDVHVCN